MDEGEVAEAEHAASDTRDGLEELEGILEQKVQGYEYVKELADQRAVEVKNIEERVKGLKVEAADAEKQIMTSWVEITKEEGEIHKQMAKVDHSREAGRHIAEQESRYADVRYMAEPHYTNEQLTMNGAGLLLDHETFKDDAELRRTEEYRPAEVQPLINRWDLAIGAEVSVPDYRVIQRRDPQIISRFLARPEVRSNARN